MNKRIVDIGDAEELGCAGDAYGAMELAEFGDAELEAVGDDYITREECAQGLKEAGKVFLVVGAILGGMLGMGVGAIGGVVVARHYKVVKT